MGIIDLDLARELFSAGQLRVAETGIPPITFISASILLFFLLFWILRDVSPLSQIPLVTDKSSWDFSGKKAKEDFMVNCRGVIKRGFEKVRAMPISEDIIWERWSNHAKVGASKPFRVISDIGDMLILPPAWAHDIRNIEELSHGEFMKEVGDLVVQTGHT